MKRTELISIGVSDICEVQSAHSGFSKARRVLNRFSAMHHSDIVELVDLLRRVTLKADGAPVRKTCTFVIDRFTHDESSAIESVEKSGMTSLRIIPNWRSGT